MNRNILGFLTAALALAVSCSSGGITPPAQTGTTSAATPAGKYIVILKPGSSVTDVAALTPGLANAPEHVYQHAMTGFAATLTAAEHTALLRDNRVSYIEPDLPVSIVKGPPGGSPPGGGGGGGGNNGGGDPTQELPWGVDRIDAELNLTNRGNGIGVAVIDTGVDLDHPDLFDVVDGVNYDKPGNPADDDNGHGTHVAGTIAAADNTIGYVGVAPEATIVAVKVLNRRGSGWTSDINAGIDWVAANQSGYNIKVANMSLSGYGFSQSMYDAIQAATAAGVTFVVAAGNESSNAGNYSPAQFDNVITVSALNPNNTFASYSNWGNPPVDLIAPGTNIPSLWKKGDYKTISGTSMASPHVAGAAALFVASNPSSTPAQVLAGLLIDGETGTWTGDPDSDYEKLVDAQSL